MTPTFDLVSPSLTGRGRGAFAHELLPRLLEVLLSVIRSSDEDELAAQARRRDQKDGRKTRKAESHTIDEGLELSEPASAIHSQLIQSQRIFYPQQVFI